jgi:hypothetical protein
MVAAAACAAAIVGAAMPAGAQVIDAAGLSGRLGPSVFEVEVDHCNGLPLGNGTAFVIGPRTLVTNAHVIGRGAPQVRLTNRDGRRIAGSVVGFGRDDWDLAVIRTEEDLPPALAFADPAALVEGQPLTVIGYPRGRYSVASGLLNSFESSPGASNREIGRTDAAVDSGNSGSPVLTAAGEVAGVVSSVDLSGITRPGRLLTRNAVTAGLAAPEAFPNGWCTPPPPPAAERLTTARLGLKVLRRDGYTVQLPLGLATRSGTNDEGDPYWESENGELSTVIFPLRDGLTALRVADDLIEFYAVDGIRAGTPVVSAKRMDLVVAMRNGTTRRVTYRWGSRRGFAMITDHSASERLSQVVSKMHASLTVR